MKTHGETLTVYCLVKEAILRRLHAVQFQLYDIQGNTRL